MEIDSKIEAKLVELYAGPREEFVVQRNALTKAIAPADAELGAWIKTLQKPNLLSWRVNRLRFENRPVFAELVESGERLRQALSDGDPAGAMTERRAAVDAALDSISESCRSEGSEISVAQRRTLSATLEALSVGATEDEAVSYGLRGLLARDLNPPGLESLAGLTLGGSNSGPKSSTIGARGRKAQPAPTKSARKSSGKRSEAQDKRETKKALTTARRRLTQASKTLEKLEADGEKARARVIEVQDLLAEVRAARAELRARIDRARGEQRRAEREVSRLEGQLG